MKIIERNTTVREQFCAMGQTCPLCKSIFQADVDDTFTVEKTLVRIACPVCHENVTYQWFEKPRHFFGSTLL